MRTVTLSFGKIMFINHQLAEVIINSNVEMTLPMVEEYHQTLLTNLQKPFYLLINKINSYSYAADAMFKIADLPEIRAMAVVTYSSSAETATTILTEVIPHENPWNLQKFGSMKSALQWLQKQGCCIDEADLSA